MKHGVNIPATFRAIVLCSFFIHYGANAQAQNNTLRDWDGNSYTIKLMPDNKKWMTANLNINIPGSYGYEKAEQKNNSHGRLYTWQAAQEGCKLLGVGWHLPTNEEWQKMAKWYGGVRDDSEDGGKAAFQALINGGKAAFNVVYGGIRDPAEGNNTDVDAHGFYWTATESNTVSAWFYNFGKNGKILNRHQDGQKQTAISVRCLCDVVK
jgi:uncharacterized protein (TIGR02145 family)